MTEHKVLSLEFGNLPVALRQELGTYLRILEQSEPGISGVTVQVLDIRIAYQLQSPDVAGSRAEGKAEPTAAHDELVRRITNPTPRDC